MSALADTVKEAIRIWDAQKAEGVSWDERVAGLERTLRASWPQGGTCHCPRCLVVCVACRDTGAVYERRPARIYGWAKVDVVVPCACPKGDAFRPKPQPSPEDFTAAGKSKPMSRMGR